ncbi:MAG: sigma-70 family RNA polymerase sigma factor [Deltaproteobacteria bacterium]|nr:sigma-70 family RNA polymerase sigma factor [Deltaproteobacteria bacterium]MBK8238185.1 sigma-70 family RNA polymerase sigma factor [Deltaproteobacteria bacterium]MBK8718466.1 sigma-70 family RNA polymerase sigma factor [Deltaproteobacteria bacterium]MBP7290304.1 sigma-70 family RNA polymerase sigma factor [Nannocystaceae bacterium]
MTNRPLSRAWAGEGPDDDEREPALAAVLAAAHASWPAEWLDDETFVRELALRRRPGEGESIALRRMTERAADLYLAIACQHGVVAAVRAFDAAHLADLGRLLRRLPADTALAEDAGQIVRERLLVGDGARGPRIADYAGQGGLAGWVRVTVVRVALNLRRARTVTLADDDDELERATEGDAALEVLRERYRESFVAALRAAVGSLDARGRTLLRLHYLDGLSIDRIAPVFGVHRSSIARWLTDARARMREAIGKALARREGLDDAAAESVAKALLSQVPLTLGSLLGPRERDA